MHFSVPHITTILTLLSLATCSPLATPRDALLPFSGKGKIIAIRGGVEIGCLTAAQDVSVDSSACATFTSKRLATTSTTRIPLSVNSTAGVCGYSYFGFIPGGAENARYKIGCGPGESTQFDGPFAVAGKDANAAYTTMSLGINRYFITADYTLPVPGTTKKVYTDETYLRPSRFQLTWKAV